MTEDKNCKKNHAVISPREGAIQAASTLNDRYLWNSGTSRQKMRMLYLHLMGGESRMRNQMVRHLPKRSILQRISHYHGKMLSIPNLNHYRFFWWVFRRLRFCVSDGFKKNLFLRRNWTKFIVVCIWRPFDLIEWHWFMSISVAYVN